MGVIGAMKLAGCIITGLLSLALLQDAAQAGDLGAAISPSARTVALPDGGTATASTFATVINQTDNTLGNCEVELPGRYRNLHLDYPWTDPATNALIPNSENVPFSLLPHGSQTLVLAITAAEIFDGVIPPVFSCATGTPADALYGVNTLELAVASPAPPDIVAIGLALPDNDGVIRIAEEGGIQGMAVAAINIGAAGNVTVRPKGIYGLNDDLPADLSICESDAQGQCKAAPVTEMVVPFGVNEVRTFSVFAVAHTGAAIPFDPANNRVDVQFLTGEQLAAAANAAITAPGPDFQVDARDALRLAQQATFGANQSVIEDIRRSGLEAWIDDQMTLADSSYADLASDAVFTNFCNDAPDYYCYLKHFTGFRLQQRFFRNAMHDNDQLRQRVAFALSQILVVSENGIPVNYGLSRYQQVMLDNAFGNYRDILEHVARSPTMGVYLSSVNSRAIGPNENFPRELMQLFSLGEIRLNHDGSPVLDGEGRTIPVYTQTDVQELARALTGWIFPTLPPLRPSLQNPPVFFADMDALAEEHDNGTKTLLGVNLTAGQSADADLQQALDIIFNHPNLPPFISRQLIQHLVTSNPSSQYVERVASVFEDNGAGVRGDMAAVIKAILMDSEARNPEPDPARAGKLREPVLLVLSAMRLIGAQTDGMAFQFRIDELGQQPFSSPSVFNFYPPDYALPGGNGLVSPSQALINMSSVFARHNLLYDWTLNGNANRWDWRVIDELPDSSGTQVDWSSWGRLAYTPEHLLDVLDDFALEEDLTTDQRSNILKAMETQTYWGDPLVESYRRARLALYLIVTSPQFQIDN